MPAINMAQMISNSQGQDCQAKSSKAVMIVGVEDVFQWLHKLPHPIASST